MVRHWLVIAILFLLSCKQEQDPGTLILEARLVGGERIMNVEVSLMQEFMLSYPAAEVLVRDAQGNERRLEWVEESQTYNDPQSDAFIVDEGVYEIEARVDDHFAHADVTVPPATEITQISATVIPINESSLGQPIFSVLWDNLDGFTHVLTLENLEDSPVEIPFSVPSGNFAELYAFPVTSQGVTLYDTDFKYYGTHRLKIYTIDSEYDALFFYQPGDAGNIVNSGPENVAGGAGFVTGLSVVEVEIELTP